jgi:hypothetical protein
MYDRIVTKTREFFRKKFAACAFTSEAVLFEYRFKYTLTFRRSYFFRKDKCRFELDSFITVILRIVILSPMNK